jgi:hypothetical protein
VDLQPIGRNGQVPPKDHAKEAASRDEPIAIAFEAELSGSGVFGIRQDARQALDMTQGRIQ